MTTDQAPSYHKYVSKNRLLPGNSTGILLKFSSWNGHQAAGVFWSAYDHSPSCFRSFQDLNRLLKSRLRDVNHLNYEKNLPPNFDSLLDDSSPLLHQEFLCSALIQLYSGQNNTLHGTLQICGSNRLIPFHSDEHLFRLLRGLLPGTSAPSAQ